jgi:hypothetical protein
MAGSLKKSILAYIRQHKSCILKEKGWARALQAQPDLLEEAVHALTAS